MVTISTSLHNKNIKCSAEHLQIEFVSEQMMVPCVTIENKNTICTHLVPHAAKQHFLHGGQ